MIASETEKRSGRRYLLLLAAYGAFVVYGSLVPLNIRVMPLSQALTKAQAVLLAPPKIGSRSDIAANCLLCVPLSFLAMGALTRKTLWRRAWLTAPVALILCLVLSVGVEFAQIFFPARTTSLLDILAQGAGAAVGIILWFVLGSTVTRWIGTPWQTRTRENAASQLLMLYTAALAFYELLPFDLTLSPVEIYHKLREGSITWIPFGDAVEWSAYTLATKVAVVVPVGYLLRILFRRKHSVMLCVAAGGFVWAAGLEFLQVFVESRYTSTTDVLLGVAGACMGGLLANRFGPVARRPFGQTSAERQAGTWIRVLLPIAWATGLTWSRWYPFDFSWPASLSERVRSHLHVPFFHQYMTTEFLAAAQVARESVLFFVFGMLTAGCVGLLRARDRWVGIVVMIVSAIVLEGGQLFVPSRVPDLTTIAINLAGGIAGILVYPFVADTFLRTKSESGSGDT